MHGEDHYRGATWMQAKTMDEFDPADSRHGHIQKNQVNAPCPDRIKHLRACGCLTGDNEVCRQHEKLLETLAYNAVIVS